MADAADASGAGTGEFTLLYFAAASTFTRKASERLPAPLAVAQLFPTLERRYPGITRQVLASCLLTVNQEYVDLEEAPAASPGATGGGEGQAKAVVQAGDEVAIIPPVSSG